jgi:hypothetical protein
LAADFQRAQLAGSAQKLSERNCIEIVTKLIGKDRVDKSDRLSLQSSALGPPSPSPAGKCSPPPFGSGGDTLAGAGVGGPNSDEGTDTVVLQVQYNPSTLVVIIYDDFMYMVLPWPLNPLHHFSLLLLQVCFVCGLRTQNQI